MMDDNLFASLKLDNFNLIEILPAYECLKEQSIINHCNYTQFTN